MKLPLFIVFLFLFLFLLLRSTAGVAEPLLLDSQNAPLSTSGYLERLDDPEGALSPEQAMASANWRQLPGSLNAGFTHDTVWLRLNLRSASNERQTWALRLSNALIDDVRLYQRDASRDWSEQQAGERVPRDLWPVDYPSAVFPLVLSEPGNYPVLLRLQSKNALSVILDLSPSQQFSNESRREFFGYGLYFGFYLILICFHAVFWRMTRAPESGWYLIYVNCCVWIEVLSLGLPQELLGLPMGVSDPLLGVAIALSIPVGMIFAGRQLGLPHIYSRLYQGLVRLTWLIAVCAAGLVLAGHYGLGARLAQGSALLLIPFFVLLAFWLLLRGHRPARYYLIAFGIFYIGAIVSFLRNMGYVPNNIWTNVVSPVGTMLHMGLMSLKIISHYNALKRDGDKARAQTTEQALRHGEHLETQVRLRTRELRSEIRRRELLEHDLRAALAKEKRLIAEQRDFVAMVSHEFRTPLAIISTSAQQLARNLGASLEKSLGRCQNIRDAAKRLMALVDDYLNHDRMDDPRPSLRLASCDLGELLVDLQGEFAEGRVALDNRLPAGRYYCDGGLLHVAVRNLLANADRHAPAGTPVRLEASMQPSGWVCLSIRNAGEAIPEDERERLFQKYYRGRQSQLSPGAGLGLYLVRRIAELHDGRVELVSPGGQDDICLCLYLSLAMADHRGLEQADELPAPRYAEDRDEHLGVS